MAHGEDWVEDESLSTEGRWVQFQRRLSLEPTRGPNPTFVSGTTTTTTWRPAFTSPPGFTSPPAPAEEH